MKEAFALLAVLLVVVGNVPYVIDILRGRVKPHAYTWFVWSVVSGIVLVGQVGKGAGVGAWPTLVSELFTVLNFLLSLKYGYRNVTGTDTLFLVVALAGILPWIVTRDPTYSVVIAVAIDVIAFIPTMRKSWIEPATENRILYVMNIIRHILALISLEAYNVATTLHSIGMITTNLIMSAFLLVSRGRRNGLGGDGPSLR